jgi:MFS family permease
MDRTATRDLLLNVGHLFDHLFMLIFATAVLAIEKEWGIPYKDLMPYAIGGAIAFGAGSIPAGWLADRWSRHGTMVVFFIGIGLASIVTAFAQTPLQLGAGISLIGLFAAIYHPVGIAMLVANTKTLGKTLGVNGVWGNLGLAFAALITGALIDLFHWRAAFVLPGLLSVAVGVWFYTLWPKDEARPSGKKAAAAHISKSLMVRVFAVLLVAVCLNSLIFNSATFAMPKLFDARLRELTSSPMGIGILVCMTYVIAAMAQLLVGHAIDRYAVKPVFIGVVVLQAPLLYLASVTQGWTLLVTCVLVMFFVFGQIPINDAIVTRYTSDEWRARALGLRYVVSFSAGATAYWLIAATQKGAAVSVGAAGAAGAGAAAGVSAGFASLFFALAVSAVIIFASALFFPSVGGQVAQPAKA